MKPLVTLFVCMALCAGAKAQSIVQLKQTEETRRLFVNSTPGYFSIDTPTSYAGGSEKWQEYQRTSTVLRDAVRAARERKMAPGRYVVTARIFVAPDGSITTVKTTNRLTGYGLEEAVIQFLKESGKWIPTKAEDEALGSTIYLPVTFVINY